MKTKVCTKCGVEKDISDFPNNKNSKDRKHWWCKLCQNESRSSWNKKYIKDNPWYNSYINAKQRCENPNNPDYPWWGAKGIKFLLSKEDMKFLWERDKASEMKFPTIDRKDNDGHYCLENCQFLENKDNSMKDRVGHWDKDRYIKYYKIGQYTKEGQLIKIWNSQGEIARELNISQSDISTNINGTLKNGYPLKSVKGFIWKNIKE